MRLVLLLLTLSLTGNSFSQTAPLKFWVNFTDKLNSEYSIENPSEFLSADAIDRRQQFDIPIIEQDLPVKSEYLTAVSSIEGVKLVHTSKWFNAVTIQIEDSMYLDDALSQIQSMNNVLEVKSALVYHSGKTIATRKGMEENQKTYTNEYGPSFAQIGMHNGQLLHELGLRGTGMKVGVFDSGFNGVNYLNAFSKLRDEGRIKLQYDVVDNDNSVLNGGNHGKSVLSIMAGFMTDSLIGSAPEADYYLFRTEDGSSEYITEEDNWVRAMEMADSIGIQVVNSSLGYTTFNDASQNHSYEDMDGNTTRISIAADIAASKGILVVNSAGNSGDDAWYYIGAPADADSILAVGAVSTKGEYAWFSSRGPSFDGDVKPNVCGVGYQTVYADLSEGISTGNGTSFSSPVIAGLSACLWQAFPEKSNMEIIHAIERSAHLYANPNDSLGNGIPDFYQAYKSLLSNPVLEDDGVLVYPNPFRDELNLVIDTREVDAITIFDNAGREVVKIGEASLGEGAITARLDVDVQNLQSGNYSLILYYMGEVVGTTRIVKLPN